jgi:hypothetical protein
MTPNDQISALKLYAYLLTTYGAIVLLVPSTVC